MRRRATRPGATFIAVTIAVLLGAASGPTLDSASATSLHATAGSSSTVWLCRPGLAGDPCEISDAVTAVTASGTEEAVARHLAPGSFDCFYVYPTVSPELTENADLTVGAAEIDAAKEQASQFSSVCSVYAPVYRQRTLLSLAAGLGSDPSANAVAYASLAAGWADFLAHYSDGKPFVLIGHSQGAAMLILLIRAEIDHNRSLRSRLVSAIVLGGNVQVPNGKIVGGSFQNVPACTSPSATGCVIAYSSFPSDPPADAEFSRPGQGVSLQSGQTMTAGLHVLCTNPAALSGGAAPLTPIFATRTQSIRGIAPSTPWVEYPGEYRAQCTSSGGATWLQVTATASHDDPRPLVSELDGAAWGYHVDDVNLALGNLVEDVASEEAAFTKAHG